MKMLALLMNSCLACWLVAAHGQDPVPTPASAPVPRAAEVKPGTEPRTDLDRLQGLWQCVEWISDGHADAARAEALESSYEGNRLTLWGQGLEYRHGLVTLDPGRTPKAMNTWDLDGPSADETNRGIYEIDGDTLKVCIVLDRTKERPTQFESKPGSKRLLLTYKRKP